MAKLKSNYRGKIEIWEEYLMHCWNCMGCSDYSLWRTTTIEGFVNHRKGEGWKIIEGNWHCPDCLSKRKESE